MKRTISIILLVVMLAFLLAGCGKHTEVPVDEPVVTTPATEDSVTDPETPADAEIQDDNPYTIKDQTLYDGEGIDLTIRKAYRDVDGVHIVVSFKNDTGKYLSFMFANVLVNGCYFDPNFSAYLEPNTATESEMLFDFARMAEYNLNDIDQISFDLYVVDEGDWASGAIIKESFTIYPTGLASNEIAPPSAPVIEDEVIAFDNEYGIMKIVSSELDTDGNLVLKCYVENKSDVKLTLEIIDAQLDEKSCLPYWTVDIASGSRAFEEIVFFDDDMKAFGVEDADSIQNVDFRLAIYNYTDWTAPQLATIDCHYPINHYAVID